MSTLHEEFDGGDGGVGTKSAATQEFELRTERARLPYLKARAAQRVEDLRGGGAREGSPELQRAIKELREIIDREVGIAEQIITVVAKRCRQEAMRINSERAALRAESDALRLEAQAAWSRVRVARLEAQELTTRLEGIEGRSERLATDAQTYTHFVEKALELEKPQMRLALLENAKREGLLLDFPHASFATAGENVSA
jgi:hypothetical protein